MYVRRATRVPRRDGKPHRRWQGWEGKPHQAGGEAGGKADELGGLLAEGCYKSHCYRQLHVILFFDFRLTGR